MTTTTDTDTVAGFVDLDGLRTYHEVIGSGDPLVLLHGGMCPIETFAGLAAELDGFHRVHRPERRAHGRTPDVPGPITYAVMADDTIAYLEAQDLDPVHLVGWSDGAVIALLVTLARPDLVRSLVFIGSALEEQGMPPFLQPLPPALPSEMLPPFLRDLYGQLSPDGPDHFEDVWSRLMPQWLDMPFVELSELDRVDVPTLVVAADDDMLTIEHAEAIRRAITGAHLAVLPGDHALPMEQPALVGAVIRRFLDQVE